MISALSRTPHVFVSSASIAHVVVNSHKKHVFRFSEIVLVDLHLTGSKSFLENIFFKPSGISSTVEDMLSISYDIKPDQSVV